ncbi:hypothetical protein [Stenotrophomonas oahuensis]|uniref:DUF4410 domain-containing protein n=1 Tax=Stenotrophomonas oahuensis TaxID=3003271 RepID=A0ABY9YL48_9GAMM|nr:hypothetical protein [Stenotrophomonas sp. A5586]WNH51612.1 hypothetical protein PDM29_14825 [Stenotrophomonas sp. A5586]
MRHPIRAAAAVLLCCASPAFAGTVQVQDPVPFSESAFIADNIKDECRMGAQLATALGNNAETFGNTIAFAAEPTTDGRVLKLEIVEAQSARTGFNHYKSATVRGVLMDDGQKVATVTARRISRGGAGGMFKGSCDVLERVVYAIGSDLAEWLANPTDDAKLGDF